MKVRATSGFTVAEFVIGLVFVGVVMGPFLVFVARIHDLNSAIAQQNRREAWRSFNDQALAAGINPALAPALRPADNPAVPPIPAPDVEQRLDEPVPGLPRIIPLRAVLGDAVAEARLAGAGFQIGAGTAPPPRTTPAAPLAPVVIPIPVVNPANGEVIAPTRLLAGAPDEPYTIAVTLSSAPGTRVKALFNRPATSLQGVGTAQHSVTAVDLLNGVSGLAWAEFAGDTTNGDRAVPLEDGRTRWLVTTPEHRLQIYEPSPRVEFAYKLGLGAPILTYGGIERPAGTTIGVDFVAFTAVQQGTTAAVIGFPAAIRTVFGREWAAQSIGFEWTFGDSAGPFSGDLAPFFTTDALAGWDDTNLIRATPIVPPGGAAENGAWTLTRTKMELGVPVLATAADGDGFHAPGALQFSAPPAAGGPPVGRLSFEGGTYLSTGPTLSLPILP